MSHVEIKEHDNTKNQTNWEGIEKGIPKSKFAESIGNYITNSKFAKIKAHAGKPK